MTDADNTLSDAVRSYAHQLHDPDREAAYRSGTCRSRYSTAHVSNGTHAENHNGNIGVVDSLYGERGQYRISRIHSQSDKTSFLTSGDFLIKILVVIGLTGIAVAAVRLSFNVTSKLMGVGITV